MDDDTATDKVTCSRHLDPHGTQSRQGNDPPRFKVIACIAGRVFKIPREDIKKLLITTRDNIFTVKNLDQLFDCSRLAEIRTR